MSSKLDFYHIDAFEAPNYEPIWRALLAGGVDARLVAVPGAGNTAARDWFDYERLVGYYAARRIRYEESSDLSASAVTTQNAEIIAPYSGKKIRLMYGPLMYPKAWGMSKVATEPFDVVLVHGEAYRKAFSHWKPVDRLPIVGYPRYDDFFSGKVSREKYQEAWGIDPKKKTIIYTPTWAENSTWEIFFNSITALSGAFNVLVKPHHCTLRMEPKRMQTLKESGLRLIDNAYDLSAVMAVGDVVLSDTRSSVLAEAFVTNRPTIGLIAHASDVEQWIQPGGLDKLTRLCASPIDLAGQVEGILGKDTFSDAREHWADSHVAYRDGSAAQKAAEAIMQAISPRRASIRVNGTKRNGPLVSVVLPTYNHLSYLPTAIRGILEQTFKDFELIIVNDGSKDGTREFLDGLKDPRIRVLHQENQRLPRALNNGFALARGELLTWTSADNYCAPHFLEALVAALNQNPDAGMALGTFAFTDTAGNFLAIHKDPDLSLPSWLQCNPGVAAFLYRRECMEHAGPYDPELEGAEDWDMWIRIAEAYPIVYVPELIYYYRQHSDSMTAKIPEKIRRASAQVVKRFFLRRNNKLDLNELYPAMAACRDRALAETHANFDLGSRLLRSPYVPPSVAASFLNCAFERQPTLETLYNLAHALARAGQWKELELALGILRKTSHPDAKAAVETLTPALEQQRPDLAPITKIFLPNPKGCELLQITQNRQRTFSLTSIQSQPVSSDIPVAAASREFKTTESNDTPTPSVNEQLAKLVANIKRNIGSSNLGEALDDIEDVLRLEPGQKPVLLAMGFTLCQLKQHEKAVAVFERVLKGNPDEVEAYVNLTSALLALGRLEQAIETLRAAQKILPENGDIAGFLLRLLVEAKRPDEAVLLCKQLLALNPNDLNALLTLARCEHANGNLSEAVGACIAGLQAMRASVSK